MTEEHLHDHPTEYQYVKIAVILAIVTAAEVAVIYVSVWEEYFRLILSTMMVVKFFMVAAYFMHLKFDSKVFRRFFYLGIVLALAVFGVVLWTFTFATRLPGAA
ncbi:MAG: cytochrome C oxidase subunit IV family protein [Actinomycetota bacterium]